MSKETPKAKRARYAEVIGAGVERRFPDEFKMDSSKEPELLVEFYFNGRDVKASYNRDDLHACVVYIDEVIKVRSEHLNKARARLRAARCLNDLEAAAHYQQLVVVIEGIIKTFEDMRSDIHATWAPDRVFF